MAFAREVLSRVPAFDTELGPGALGFGEDSLFSQQLTAAGYHIISAQDVCVEHHFDAARLSRAGFLDRFIKEGRSLAYVAHHWEHEVFVNPWKRLVRALLRLAYYRKWRRVSRTHSEGMSEWEIMEVLKIAKLQQFLRERVRPRNYEKHGLVKLAIK